MKKMIKGTVFVCCLALAACGSDNNDTNNGTNNGDNNGATNNGATNNGATNNGATNNGATNNGATNNGTGDLAVGDDCSILDTCADSHCAAKADDVCDGVCTAFLATGDACAAQEGFCDWATDVCDYTGTMVCVAKAAKAAECFTGQCETGSFCEKAAAGDALGTCVDLIAVDQPCPAFFGCEAGLYCDAAAAAPVCTAPTLELGDDCTAAAAADCKAPNYCDTLDTLKCIAVEATVCD